MYSNDMNYTNNITSKGQITIPKEFRDKLGLSKLGKANLSMNERGEVVISAPKDLAAVRSLLGKPSFKDQPSGREKLIGSQLAKKYGVR